MGGAQSYFDETDWGLADGSLRSCDETTDGRLPTAKYQTYELVKRSIVANQRELDVTDSEKNLMFHVRPSPGTIAGFDVLGIGSANNDDYILRVTVDLARRYWIIYRFDKPVFEGQKPDPIATEKFALEQHQSVGNERKELAARISASLAIHSFSDDSPVDVVVPPAPIVPKHFLYKVGCVTVSWSRYMAVAAYYGPPTIEQIMQATEAACKKELSTKKKSSGDGNETDDDDGDLLREARKIAGRLREERDGMDESERSGKAETDISNGNVTTSIEGNEGSEQSSLTVSALKSNAISDNVNRAATISRLKSDQPSLNDKDEIDVTESNDLDSTPDRTAESVACENKNETHTVVSARHHSLADDLADESESDVETSNDSHHAETTQTSLTEEQQHSIKKNDLPGNDALDEIQTSSSMPEFSHAEKPGSPNVITNGLQKWWQESSRALHENTIAKLRPKGMSEDYTNSNVPITGGAHASAFDASSSSKHSDGGTNSGENGVGVASFLGIGKNSTADDPLQGVVHLDKPLLLCQEIYTRIIGNHQTSKVSKEKVLTLLRQDMEQHIQNRKDDDEIEDFNNIVEAESLTLTHSASHETNHEKATTTEVCVTGKPPVEKVENATTAPLGNTDTEKNIGDKEGPTGVSVTTDESQQQQEPPPKEQPLVGYWAWENTLRTHKMKMHLGKGSDLALHIVLAVLVNQLRYERNAIAIAV